MVRQEIWQGCSVFIGVKINKILTILKFPFDRRVSGQVVYLEIFRYKGC